MTDTQTLRELRPLAHTMNYDEGSSFLEERFSGYLPVGEEELLKASYAFDPYHFGGLFPAQSVEEDGSTYEGASDRSRLPGAMLFSVRFYYPSMPVRGERDGRAEAKSITRKLHGAWREAMLSDLDLRRLIRDVRITTTEAGDVDAMGGSRTDERGESILWMHRSVVQVMP